MRKLLGFFRSMRLGLILMSLIAVCSLAGSVITQNEDQAYYALTYGETAASVITALRLDDVFSSWYFISLLALLCVNLVFCSILRFYSVRAVEKRPIETYVNAPATATISEGRSEALVARLRAKRYKETRLNGATVFSKNRPGYYGSFITHLALLFILVFSAATLYFAQVEDIVVMPGETYALEDGLSLRVDDFKMSDENGQISYESSITVIGAQSQTGAAIISVNNPYTFGNRKFYQHTYGVAGSVEVTNIESGQSSLISLKEPSMISLDGTEGLRYQAVYPNFMGKGVAGGASSTADGSVYECVIVKSDGETPVLSFPGDTLEAGGIRFTFNKPVFYPGIRVKTAPLIWLYLLYASFAVMIIGLWLCFFCPPVHVVTRETEYAVLSPKDVRGLELELRLIAEDSSNE